MQSRRSPAPAVWNSFSIEGVGGVGGAPSHLVVTLHPWMKARVGPPPIKAVEGGWFRSWMFLLLAIFYAALHHRPGVGEAAAAAPVPSCYTCRTCGVIKGEGCFASETPVKVFLMEQF